MESAHIYCLILITTGSAVYSLSATIDNNIIDFVTTATHINASQPSNTSSSSAIIPPGCDIFSQSENGTFSAVGELTVVCGANASIDDIPQSLPEDLVHLIITDQNITNIQYHSFPYIQLKTLTVQYCQLELIHNGAFEQLVNLEYLDLSINSLESSGILSDSFKGLVSLSHLSLVKNPLVEIHTGTFLGSEQHMPSLQLIDLSWTQLEQVHDGAFVNFSIIHSVDLSHNVLTDTAMLSRCGDNDFQSIHKLNLSFNSINNIISDEGCVEQLKVLDLSFNNITELDETCLQGVDDNLEELFLSHNSIRDISNFTINRPGVKLKVVDLSYNDMRGLEEDDLGPVVKLVVHHNPWHCDCTVSWFVYTDSVAQHNHRDHLKCASPMAVANESVLSLGPAFSKHCPDYPKPIPRPSSKITAITLAAFGLVFGILLASGLTYAVRKRAFQRRMRDELHNQLMTSEVSQTQHDPQLLEASSAPTESAADINNIESLLYLPHNENAEQKLHAGENEPNIRGRLELF